MRLRSPFTLSMMLLALVLSVLALPATADEAMNPAAETVRCDQTAPVSAVATADLREQFPDLNLAPTPEEAASNCRCFGPSQTAHGWGCGSTCAIATAACEGNAYSQMGCIEGACEVGQFTYNPAGGCVYDHSMCPGQYLRDCDVDYKCRVCF